ncbi:unnamed protein product [Periconia digitata]|uniref:Uncharacterized protein n=1 Tax=Periconia digitata TaxID=1303443 RepID=A0A9W4U549_9PLEO|nr:unnamed protein product [Periconia digitata]
MAARTQTENSRPGDLLVVVHEFHARSPDELALARGDRVELIERDDDFGDGWFLGRNTETGDSGLFPEVYTRPAPKPTINAALHQRNPSQTPSQHDPSPAATPDASSTPPAPAPLPLATANTPAPAPASQEATPNMEPLPLSSPTAQSGATNRTSLSLPTRSISQTLSGDVPNEDETINSPVMHETLSVIDEHITDMSTPRHSVNGKDARGNDSGSEYSSHHRMSYINGQETEEEEQGMHTEEEVSTWSPARVAEYLEDVGVERKHCDIFKEQEINGEVLLGIDQATIFLKEFELGPVGPRLRTWLKIKALQQEVKTMKEAQKNMALLEAAQEQPPADPARNRATSMSAVLPRIPSLGQAQGQMKSNQARPPPRANSTAGHSPLSGVEATPPLAQYSPVSPKRPSAASVRSLNHNRRHSSIDSAINQPPPTSAGAMRPPSIVPQAQAHKKTPSFDRGWTMGSPQEASKRPSSSHHGHSTSADMNAFGSRNGEITPIVTDLDRGYFSGGEVDNRKARNVLRKKDSPNHSRTPSLSSEASRRNAYGSRRHNRMTSAESASGGVSPLSPAAKAYYGSSVRSGRSSSNAEYGRPVKSLNEMSPTVTKLDYNSPSIDAVARSPRLPTSESSSTGRASPSPAAQTHSHSFFGKKSRAVGLRAISDAITGGQSNTSIGDSKESPLQSPTRTGSTTPSGASASKSFDSDSLDINKRLPAPNSAKDSAKRRSKKHNTSAYTRGREPISPQEAMKNCDYSGWMKKKSSSLMTTWKTRLFVLRGRRLSYYYSEYDTEEKGLIDISSHRVLPANNERITGFHVALTRAASSPSSPQNATIPTAADNANGLGSLGEDMAGMFIFKLVPPRVGLQRGVQFTKPIVHYFAVDNIQVGRLWMAALMKATIDRDDSLAVTTTYQQRTITLDKARQMRQRPPALMDDDDTENQSVGESKKSAHSKESLHESVIHEEDEKQGLAISGLDDAKALLDFAENGEPEGDASRPQSKRKESIGMIPGVVS